MRRFLPSRWTQRARFRGVVVMVAALGVSLGVSMGVSPAMAGAAPIITAEDRDGDGIADLVDPCPDSFGTSDNDDGFAGCVQIGQQVYLVRNGGRVSGQVSPDSGVCREGIKVTLTARWYTDHDPTTVEGSLTESAWSDDNGFFLFKAELPFGTEYSAEVSPQAIADKEAFCASARTTVYRHVEEVRRDVQASYKSLTGTVTGRVVMLTDPMVEEACSDLQPATLLRRSDDGDVVIGSTTFRGDETFSIAVGQLEVGAHYYVQVAERGPEGYPDLCRKTSSDITVLPDRDDDGVEDAEDACGHVPGPQDADVPGCAVVERRLTADYDGERVTGALTIVSRPPTAGNPCEARMLVELSTVDALGRRTFAGSVQTGGGRDQTYSLAVSPRLPDGTHFVVTTQQTLQPGVALCGAAESGVRVSDDRDDDGVPDGSDACRTLVGTAPSGCPTVTRSVSASYRTGRLTGQVSVLSLGGAPAGACSGPAQLQAWQGSGASRVPVSQPVWSLADGSYSIPVALASGPTVRVSVFDGYDVGRAFCGAADSREVVAFGDRDDDGVPDSDDDCPDVPASTGGAAGCPVVARALTASYAAGTVSGTARPVAPAVAPAGACTGAPVDVSWTAADGRAVLRTGSVRPDGSYDVDTGRPPVGTVLTVSLDAFSHDQVAVCPAVEPSTSVTVVSDRDDDGVPDTADQCPDAQGPARVLYSGCRLLDRVLTTSYADGVLTGSVRLADVGSSPAGACSARSLVEVVSLEGSSFKDNLGNAETESDGTFAVAIGRLVDGTAYHAWAEGFLDPSAGVCKTADAQRVFVDRDGDGFGDGEDACPDVDGPAVGTPGFSEAFRGCPLVDLTLSAVYADQAVSGRLRATDPLTAPAGACAAAAQVRVDRVIGELDSVEIGHGETSAEDGTYSIFVGPQPTGTRLRVRTYFPQVVVASISACAPSRSEVVDVVDGDGDSVPDQTDKCPAVPAGPGSTVRLGCPTLARQVTATYVDGAVSGEVRLAAPTNAPDGACVPATVDVYLLLPGASTSWLASTTTDAVGHYELSLAGPPAAGSRFTVVADAFSDGDLADCALAESGEVVVAPPDLDGDGVADGDDLCDGVAAPDGYHGCPTAARSMTTKYESAAVVSGRVRVVDPGLSPGTCLSATVQVLRVEADGRTTLLGSKATEPDGSYRVVLGQPLAGGDVYFALLASSVDRELAFCAGAQSGSRLAPVVKTVT